jgi:hypothetical protein
MSLTEVQNTLDACLNLIPGEDDLDECGCVEDAVSAVCCAYRTRLTGASQEAAWAARRAYECSDNRALAQRRANVSRIDDEDVIARDPSVQSELQQQLRDLEKLLLMQAGGGGPFEFGDLRGRAKRPLGSEGWP